VGLCVRAPLRGEVIESFGICWLLMIADHSSRRRASVARGESKMMFHRIWDFGKVATRN
jgi:hypothetical protein